MRLLCFTAGEHLKGTGQTGEGLLSSSSRKWQEQPARWPAGL